jgi:hypothetical protein
VTNYTLQDIYITSLEIVTAKIQGVIAATCVSGSTVVTEITMVEITYQFTIQGDDKIVIVTLSQVTPRIDDTETIDMTAATQTSDVEARTTLMTFTRTIPGVEIEECQVGSRFSCCSKH